MRTTLNVKSCFKSILCILFLFCFSLVSIPTFATADIKVYDYANLFSTEELEELEATAKTLSETYQLDVGIVTTNDAEGKTAEAYADDFYDNKGYGYGSNADGLLFLMDMDNRKIWIFTCGLGIQYFTDARIEKILDSLYEYVSNADYYGAANDFLELTKSYINKGIPTNQHTVDRTPHVPFQNAAGQPLNSRSIGLSIIAAIIGSGIITLIARGIVIYRYKHPHFTEPSTKPDSGSVHYTQREDRFVSTHTHKVKIEKNNNGTSTTHTSSSGRSHGGGGRSF